MRLDNRISLYKLEVFRLVAELGGVNQAAAHLFVSQPVVTTHVRSLEERLGVKLFDREGRSMRLTEAGEAVYGWASEIVTRGHEIEREIVGLADGTKGAAAIAASMSVGSYILPPILAQFVSERPGADITLHISDPERAMEAAETGICDFAVVIAENVDDSYNLEGEKIGEEDLVLLAAPQGNPLEDSVPAAKLVELPFVCSPKGMVRRLLVERQLERIGIRERKVVIELGHPEAMKKVTQSGLGVTLLFRSAIEEELAAGSLREIRIEDANLSVPVFIVWRRGKRLSPLQQHLHRAIKEHVETS